jgi:ABC-type glycerol-3-phosphate transport system substrate-binding protein
MFALLCLLLGLASGGAVACGGISSMGSGANSGTTPGIYTISVSGSSGATTVTTVVNLIVR